MKTNSIESNLAKNYTNVKNVLLIDDYELTCKIVSMLLQDLGHFVDVANNGANALAMTSKNKNYQIILLDLNLPDINGLDLALKLRTFESLKRAKIIAFTGHDNFDANYYQQYGIDDFLSKPFTRDKIVSLINGFDLKKS
jgi:CheY-like chemotaxis protein